jgi:glycosyltransferase involved in cell wall biosynthesis
MNTVDSEPVVSVIIPARNEEAGLGACLESLVTQTGVAFEIIVVDDHSTDRTPEITSSFSNRGVRFVEAGSLPPGWTGKNSALVDGVREARGKWLLFTDADTLHLPGSLARALEEATRRKVSLLSYSPQQIVESFWEKAVMPVVFGELAATYQPSQVSDPNCPAAAANGQYILITREAYAAAGGHATVADQILEDVALARAVKRSGRAIFFRYAPDAVRTRMYHNFAELREGWSKNLALLFSSPLRLAALRGIEFLLISASLTIAAANFIRGHERPVFFAGMLALGLYAVFSRRLRLAHFSWRGNVLALAGLPVFSYLLLRSRRLHKFGGIAWKGRIYPGSNPCATIRAIPHPSQSLGIDLRK